MQQDMYHSAAQVILHGRQSQTAYGFPVYKWGKAKVCIGDVYGYIEVPHKGHAFNHFWFTLDLRSHI